MLDLDDGAVYPAVDERIGIAGSSILISDLWGDVTPADITIRGRGALGAILALIDREPLALVSKLGLDPRSISGRAEVETVLSFPLIQDLLLEDIGADAKATLSDVAIRLPLGDGMAVTGERVALRASTTEMTIAGDVVADGIPANVDWREVYGETPSRREVVLTARATPALLARFGVELPGFEAGSAGTILRLSQTGADGTSFRVEADLAGARFAIPQIGWSKPEGTPGTATASGRMSTSGAAEVEDVRLDAAGLRADASLTINSAGAVERATFRRLRLGERADLALEVTGLGERGRALTIRGRFLDLAALREIVETGDEASGQAGADGPAPDLTIDFDIDSVKLTDRVVMEPARGSVTRADGGPIRVDLSGDVNGSAPVRAELSLPESGDGALSLASDDAGAFLRATGLAEAARDGRMSLKARLRDGGLDRFDGSVELSDITLREAKTFERILRQGNVQQTVTVESGGLSFNEVRIPFAYDSGTLTLGTSIATGPAMAVKIDGTIEEETGALDLSGVISPAYAVTGALNNIPLLGAILSGGKGEGILAMTFRVGGTIEDPSYTVNPLSILAPGFLRRIFTSKARTPDERFMEGLKREN